ncbi:hypothetical protein N7492_009737 [Penicillium capsulatum]|uniref:Uncharacterized protein n=1 Tax=Penicillium capsulatum TaxID=69766 RepID=A0A9W9HK25_9EURO|nr:hypothetical protein N7492_010722 [Penicillium capsulatum]KAJ5152457.1 hypothetical protein N7492_009737 [Penicillium capsulatum]KAJ6114055.1 hypothetical protein N7512_007500 [Penicillium capsulatum]KAJ6114180.1 hypothetical protein N7512_007625 [Penicillium capsulatum]
MRYRSAAIDCLLLDCKPASVNGVQALVLIGYSNIHYDLPSLHFLRYIQSTALSIGCYGEALAAEPTGVSSPSWDEREDRRYAWLGFEVLRTLFEDGHSEIHLQPLPPAMPIFGYIKSIETIVHDRISIPGSEPTSGLRFPTGVTYCHLAPVLHIHTTNLQNAHVSFPTDPSAQSDFVAALEPYVHPYTIERPTIPQEVNRLLILGKICILDVLSFRRELYRHLQNATEFVEPAIRCITSAKFSLHTFTTLGHLERPLPYQWYTSGIGRLHVLPALVVLADYIRVKPSALDSQEIVQDLHGALETLAFRRSPLVNDEEVFIRTVIDQWCQLKDSPNMMPVDPPRSSMDNNTETGRGVTWVDH